LYRLSHPLGIRVYSGAPHFQIIASLRQTPVQLFILFGYSLAPLHIFTTSTSTRPLGLAAARDRRLHPVPCGHARQDNIHAGAVGRPVADRSDVTAAAVGGGGGRRLQSWRRATRRRPGGGAATGGGAPPQRDGVGAGDNGDNHERESDSHVHGDEPLTTRDDASTAPTARPPPSRRTPSRLGAPMRPPRCSSTPTTAPPSGRNRRGGVVASATPRVAPRDRARRPSIATRRHGRR
jgi:hypothetical protein